MKKLLTLAVGLLVLGAARADVVWQAEPPNDVPDSVPLVQVFPTPVSRDILLRQAGALGISRDGQVSRTPAGLAFQSGNKVLALSPFGSTFYAQADLYFVGKPGLEPLQDQRAQSVAGSLLDRLFPWILVENGGVRVRHLMSQSQDLRSGRLNPATQDESIVEYSRQLNKIPVVGPGDVARVHVANDGTITGVQSVWRNTKVTGDLIGLLRFPDVKDAFLKQLQGEMGDGSVRVFVTGIQFGYYSRAENQPQGWYQPCYLFSVSFYNNKLQQETGARQIPIPAFDPAKLREPLDTPPDTPNNGDPGKILFGDVKPPAIPAAVPVVQVQPSEPNSDTMLSRLRRLGGVAGKIDQNGRGLVAADSSGNTLLYQDRAGAEFFGHMDRMLAEKPGEASPISDAIAIRTAHAWLDKLGDISLAEIGEPTVQHLFQQAFDINNNKPQAVTQDETIVTYPRQIVDPRSQTPIPLIGQGTGIDIHVDNNGAVTGHHRVWRNLSIVPGVLTPTLPYEAIQQAFIRRLTPELGIYAARITGIQFGLFSRPEGFQQGWLLPAVQYDVDLINPDTGQVTAHRQIPIPASADQPEDLEDPTAAMNPPADEDSRIADAIPTLYGDIDGDGKVTTKDAALALAIYGGLENSVPPAQFTAGDVAPAGAPDHQIAMDDGLRILRSIFNLDDISNGP